MPLISVIMPVYNTQAYLKEAIESILSQTFGDFEFLIFNDGSKDDSKKIILSFQDERIRFFDFAVNQGYVKLLNIGLEEARGKYIARMDADDVADTQRFSRQVDFMEKNPEYIVCGTRYRILGSEKITELPLEDEEIKLKLLYITPFCHPSVFIRASIIKEKGLRYKEAHVPAEDHELWVRLSLFGRMANLKEPLLLYRIHNNNISMQPRTSEQTKLLDSARFTYIKQFFDNRDTNDVTLLFKLFHGKEFQVSYQELKGIGELIQRITDEKETAFPVSREKVLRLLLEKFLYRCITSTHHGMKVFFLANKHNFARVPILYNTRLFVKSLIRYSVS